MAHKVSQLMEDGLLDELMSSISSDIASEIVSTSHDEHEKREELYHTSLALKRLKMKLQECVNATSEA